MAHVGQNCRCCMKLGLAEMTNLESSFHGLQLSILYFNCTGIRISNQEQLPQNVCEECVGQLQNFNAFRENCIKADSFFRCSNQVKVDPTHFEVTGVTIKAELLDDTFDNNYYCDPSEQPEKESSKTSQKEVKSPPDSEYSDDSDEYDDDESDMDDDIAKQGDRTAKPTRKRDRKAEKKHLEIFPCTVAGCKKRFFVKRLLEGHLRRHDGKKEAVCPHCDKQFTKFYTLDEHILAIHTPIATPLEIKCPHPSCTKIFPSEALYKRHSLYAHKPKPKGSGERCYTCHQCGKSFSNSAALKKHIYTHYEVKPFQCTSCPKSFVTKDKLKHHNNRHLGIKNFVCPTCGLRKTTKDELRNHINTHTKEITYPCTVEGCAGVFGSRTSVKRHVKNVHEGARDFRCSVCEQCYAKKETLKNHMSRVHGMTL